MRSNHVVFTDLDGTLLDHDTYSWEAARPAIEYLKELQIPWVFVTSKTRAETEYWREAMGNDHPFIIENGGAAYVPDGYLPTVPPVMVWGTPYARLVAALRKASETSACEVRGFADMSVSEVAESCGLHPQMAELAKQREYDEPFVVLNSAREEALVQAIETKGLTYTRGGRFRHVMGGNDKGTAVRTLKTLYELWNGPVTSIAIGDGWNDLPMLAAVDIPVLMPSTQQQALQRRLPGALLGPANGPEGWNQVLLSLISQNGIPARQR